MQILVAIRRGFALDLRHAPTDMWLSGTSAQVSSILAHSSNTANSKLAARYADASTENTLRAREALLPKLQPGNDDGTQWSPARRGSIVMAKTVDDISPRGWTLAHDTQAVTQIARHMVKVGAASDKTPFKMFWEWKNEMQTAGNSKWEPFPGMDSDWAPLFNTIDLDTKYEDNTKACNQLSHKIFGMNHERFCNWLISREFEAHLQSHQRSFHSRMLPHLVRNTKQRRTCNRTRRTETPLRFQFQWMRVSALWSQTRTSKSSLIRLCVIPTLASGMLSLRARNLNDEPISNSSL